jgi:lysophospholipase L1-like esterase
MVKIFTIGDSLTAGYPDYDPVTKGNKESSFQYWLEKTLNEYKSDVKTEIYNYGLPGDSSHGFFSRLTHLSKEKHFLNQIFLLLMEEVMIGLSFHELTTQIS